MEHIDMTGQELKELRITAGLTQAAIATALQTTNQSISDMERGKQKIREDGAMRIRTFFAQTTEHTATDDNPADDRHPQGSGDPDEVPLAAPTRTVVLDQRRRHTMPLASVNKGTWFLLEDETPTLALYYCQKRTPGVLSCLRFPSGHEVAINLKNPANNSRMCERVHVTLTINSMENA
jgi:transcriptional regulator with XRE-family HTH domain